MQGGDWVTLTRGQVVPDGGRVRTESNGRVELVRGAERISLAANTEISIRDAGDQKMTSVIQSRGTVTVDAERRNVQHFSVQTPVLAAVVKGTQFTVTYSNGQASVSVDRGVVQVQDAGHEMVVDVTPGQVAEARQTRPLDVSGPGSENAVFMIQGEVVPAAAREAVLSGNITAAEAVEVVRENPELLTAAPGRNDAGNGRGADQAERNSGPGNNNGQGNANGPGKGNGPGANNGGGRGDGPGKGNGPGKDDGPGRGHGPDKDDGPGKGDGPGNGRGNERGSENGNGPGGNNGNGNGPGSNSGNGNGPGSNSGPDSGGPGNGNGPGKNEDKGHENSDGPGKGHGPGGRDKD